MTTFDRNRALRCRPACLAVVLGVVIAAPAGMSRAQDALPGVVTEAMENKSDLLDVPFVPSHDNVLKAMFEMAKPTGDDFVIDLGSGDGRIVIAAARDYGAQGFGVDLNDDLVAVANYRAQQAGVADRAKFFVRNLFETDIRQATVLTMYLLPDIVQDLRPKLLDELRPGARIVSHDYHMGEWRPDEIRLAPIGDHGADSVIYFWHVPAGIAGNWQWEIRHKPHFGDTAVEYTVAIRQSFQDFGGDATVDLAEAGLHDTRLDGKRVRFSITGEVEERLVRHDFDGIVDGDRIAGTVRLSGGVQEIALPWEARRTGQGRTE